MTWKLLTLLVGEILPSPTCRFTLDGAPGTRRDFFLVCPNALAASTDCQVLVDRWFQASFCSSVLSLVWVPGPRRFRLLDLLLLLLPLAGWTTLTSPGILSSKPVQEVWGVYLEMLQFVPGEVRQQFTKDLFGGA